MLTIISVLSILFFIGFIYSFIISKFLRNKLIIFLPSIVGALWMLYNIITTDPHEPGGYSSLATFLANLLIFFLVLGNAIGGLIFIRKR